jgi:hypothetical protein
MMLNTLIVVLSTYYVLCVIDCTTFVIMHPEPDNSVIILSLTVSVVGFRKIAPGDARHPCHPPPILLSAPCENDEHLHIAVFCNLTLTRTHRGAI